jgi:predicted glycoside hydrolase/deacetylase ChbG (UPF0249 family)
LIVNTPSFDTSVAALRERPALEVAIHLNLTDGQPVLPADAVPTLVDDRGRFYGGRHYGIVGRILSGRMRRDEVHREWRAQIAKAHGAGLALHELNSHGHLHLLPQLHDIVLALRREFNIPQVRLVHIVRMASRRAAASVLARPAAEAEARRHISGVADRTFGLRHPGSIDTRIKLGDLAAGERSTVELIVHPSRGTNAYHDRWGYAGDDVLNWLLGNSPSKP